MAECTLFTELDGFVQVILLARGGATVGLLRGGILLLRHGSKRMLVTGRSVRDLVKIF